MGGRTHPEIYESVFVLGDFQKSDRSLCPNKHPSSTSNSSTFQDVFSSTLDTHTHAL